MTEAHTTKFGSQRDKFSSRPFNSKILDNLREISHSNLEQSIAKEQGIYPAILFKNMRVKIIQIQPKPSTYLTSTSPSASYRGTHKIKKLFAGGNAFQL